MNQSINQIKDSLQAGQPIVQISFLRGKTGRKLPEKALPAGSQESEYLFLGLP